MIFWTFLNALFVFWDFPGGLDGKVAACNAGDPDSIPQSGRVPGERILDIFKCPFSILHTFLHFKYFLKCAISDNMYL